MKDDMLKVMLVDDEENTRNLIKLCLDWNNLGMMIIGEASSGREALDQLEELSPDIIITDIRMPFMDGLEFSQLVVERYPTIRIIVLTAHEEFDYAQKGIKLGIADFLLKPIKRSELKETVLCLKNKIETERTSREEYDKLKKQVEESFPYLKEKFLNELLQSHYSIDEINNKIQYFSLDSIRYSGQIALIETSQQDNKDYSQEDKVLFNLMCVKMIKKYFEQDTQTHIFIENNQRIAILNSNTDVLLLECCEQIKTMLMNKLKCYVSIGIGNPYNHLENIKKAYNEACQALKYKVVYGKNQIVSFSDIRIKDNDTDSTDWDKNADVINEIGFYIKAGLEEKAMELIDPIFDHLERMNSNLIGEMRIISINVISKLLNSITELGLNYDDVFQNGILPYQAVLVIDTIDDMKKYLKSLVQTISDAIKNIRTSKTNHSINSVVTYLKSNYANEKLSLSSIASAFYMNASYLSRLFKQETSYTFVEYLTRLRIEKALSLFNETDLKAYEVAQEVGIPDPNYFGKCFKKYTGVSVNDYKKNQQSKC